MELTFDSEMAVTWSRDLNKLMYHFTLCIADDATLRSAEHIFKPSHPGNYDLVYYNIPGGGLGFTVKFHNSLEQTWWALSQRITNYV